MVQLPVSVRGLLLAAGLTGLVSSPLRAQPADCAPPAPGEYLLLVLSQTPATQAKVQRSLPPNTAAVVCRYRETVVMRVGGFGSVDLASSWAAYLTETVGVATFIARPTDAPPASLPTSLPDRPTATGATSAYNPQPLGAGFAVLVDFAARPEVAQQVHQAIGKEVGLVAYQQRPYLLAVLSPDQAAATTIQRLLTDRGFASLLVDGQQVMLLRSAIDWQRGAGSP